MLSSIGMCFIDVWFLAGKDKVVDVAQVTFISWWEEIINECHLKCKNSSWIGFFLMLIVNKLVGLWSNSVQPGVRIQFFILSMGNSERRVPSTQRATVCSLLVFVFISDICLLYLQVR